MVHFSDPLIKVVPAEISKQEIIIKAQAEGNYEILKQMAKGFGETVKAVGGAPEQAVMMMIADKLENLMKIQVDAISGIKIDKITVWDSGTGGDGNTSTANFVKGMLQTVPPIQEMFKMSGMELPKWLGSDTQESVEASKDV